MLRCIYRNVFSNGYMCICSYVGLYFPRLDKVIKDKNLGVGNQLTEMVGTFASIKRDAILNSVLWVLG